MKLSVTSWSFPACTLEETAGLAKLLGIGALDLGLFYRSALDRNELLSNPTGLAEKVQQLGVEIPNYYHLFGKDPMERNLADGDDLGRNLADLEKVVSFCKAAGIPTVFILPGMVNPGQSRLQAFKQSADALKALLPIAGDGGVQLTIEPHVHSFLESPDLTLELLEAVPGLKLTLDYAHFTCLGFRQHEIDALAPHAAHVHLRQARPGALQTKIAEGTINMPAQFGTLRDAGFAGSMALECVHQDYMGTLFDDVLTETIALRNVFRTWHG